MQHLAFSALAARARCVAVAASAVCLTACASLQVQSNYQPPRSTTIPNTATVAKPFDAAWDDFVRRLSQTFFAVHQISRDSRLISISVDAGRAAEFIDCGRLQYEVNGKPWTFTVAETAQFRDGGFRKETVIDHVVTPGITRMNIFLGPAPGGTLFEVNSTYSVHIKQTGSNDVKNLYGQVVDSDYLPTRSAAFDFTTRSASVQSFGDNQVTCRATGEWERQILDLIGAV
jgi:hypothetical protein